MLGSPPFFRRKPLVLFSLILLISVILILLIYPNFLHSVYKEHRRYFSSDYNLLALRTNQYSLCDGNFVGYAYQFAVLKHVTIQPHSENFFLPCRNLNGFKYKFDSGKEGTHLNRWFSSLQNYTSTKNAKKLKSLNTFSNVMVAVKRYEYANLYHTMTDWYNVFLVTKILDLSPKDVDILLFDNFPRGHMDQTWEKLFGNIIKLYNTTKPVEVNTLIWNILGYESPLNYHGLLEVPYIESFRSFFLGQYSVNGKRLLKCESPSINFLWRRDYVAHAGNKRGLVSRKVANEKELVEALKKHYPNANIDEYNFEKHTFEEQLDIISRTDILISMHGAGLSHILFLPSHAGVVELFPLYWRKFPGMNHFEAFARWRHLKYSSWQNMNPNNEVAECLTNIPPTVILQHVDKVLHQICPNGT